MTRSISSSHGVTPPCETHARPGPRAGPAIPLGFDVLLGECVPGEAVVAAVSRNFAHLVGRHPRDFRGKGEGNLYVNLVGREARGVVTPGREYEDLRNEVVGRLTGLADDRTGEVAIEAVHRREELFDGPYCEAAPDLIVEWRDFAYMPTESDADWNSVFTERWANTTWPTSGSHRIPGLFLGNGPAIGSGDVGEVALVDIARNAARTARYRSPQQLRRPDRGARPMTGTRRAARSSTLAGRETLDGRDVVYFSIARIFTTACASCSCGCRRCGSIARTSRCSCNSSAACWAKNTAGRKSPWRRKLWRRCKHAIGMGTFAS